MFVYTRKVAYYETDKMGIVHHANYIKWMEEARIAFLESIGLPFQQIEARGIVSPVASLAVDYKAPTTFGEAVAVSVKIEKYTGVQLEIAYTMTNASTGKAVATAVSRHCFLKDGRIASLKRIDAEIHDKLAAAAQQ